MHDYYEYIKKVEVEIQALEDWIKNNKKSKKFIISKLESLKEKILLKKDEYQLKYLKPRDIILLDSDEKKELYSISDTLRSFIIKCDDLKTDALSLE